MNAAALLLVAVPNAPLAAQDAALPPHRVVTEAEEPVHVVRADEDRELLFVLVGEQRLRGLSLADGATRWEVELPTSTPRLRLDLGGKRVFAFTGTEGLSSFDAEEGGAPRPEMGLSRPMESPRDVVADPKDRWVWVGCGSGYVARLTPGEDDSIEPFVLMNFGTTCMTRDPRARWLAVGGNTGDVHVFDFRKAPARPSKTIPHGAGVTALAFGPRGDTLASAGADGFVRTWKVSSGKALRELPLAVQGDPSPGGASHLAIDPGGGLLAAGCADGKVRVFDLKKGERLASFGPEDGGAVGGLVFVGKGKELAAAHGNALLVWDLSEL